MQMNDIIDGLGSCEYAPVGSGCSSNVGNCAGALGNYPAGIGNYGGFGSCGFGWWIWILLILFYSNQGNNGYVNNSCCGNSCCGGNSCCCGNSGNYGLNNGGSYCGTWLFLLVILFLCGNCSNSGFGGCGGYGGCGGFGGDCLGLGQGYDGLFGSCC